MNRLGERHPALMAMAQGRIDGKRTRTSLSVTWAVHQAGRQECQECQECHERKRGRMKRDQMDHIPRQVLRQLDAGRLQMAETHLALIHLLACPSCFADYRVLLRARRVSPIPGGDSLLSGWGREDHLDFETLRALVDLRFTGERKAGERKERTNHREDEPSESRDWWALEHLDQCRLCQWAVDDLVKFITGQREVVPNQAPRGILANQRRGWATMGIHLRVGKRGWAGGGRRFFLPVGVGILLLLGELSLA